MAKNSLFLLPGDGIGPEIMAEVETIIAFLNRKGLTRLLARSRSGRRFGL